MRSLSKEEQPRKTINNIKSLYHKKVRIIKNKNKT